MNGTETQARPAIASPEEDPNVTIVGSSPPCFLHELDPSYLGYLRREEVSVLLEDLLATEWFGTVLETAWLRAMLRRHLALLGNRPVPDLRQVEGGGRVRGGADAGSGEARRDLLARLHEALPRLHDDALRSDLVDLLWILRRDMQRRHARPNPA